MACVCTPVSARTSASLQAAFSDGVPGSTVPFVRRRSFLVNVRIRPLLFWIGRDAIGDAHLTWRAGTGGHRAFAFLIGSDPARTPRKINRWGFIVEELNDAGGEILAVMKDSGEKTIEEAEAGIARETETSTFKAVRTTIDGSRVSSGSITFHAPAHLTYRELEALLALMPNEPSQVRTVELPPGTEKGFLAAMDSLIRASLGPCGTASGSNKGVPLIPYLYNHTFYDLSLESCEFRSRLRTKTDTFADVVDSRFQMRNRTTRHKTPFRVIYGTSGELSEVPVRAVFRPHWWMEVELVLDRSANRPLEVPKLIGTTRTRP